MRTQYIYFIIIHLQWEFPEISDAQIKKRRSEKRVALQMGGLWLPQSSFCVLLFNIESWIKIQLNENENRDVFGENYYSQKKKRINNFYRLSNYSSQRMNNNDNEDVE